MLVYKYGARAPIEGADMVDRQLYLANRYRNDLVETERAFLKAVKGIREEHRDDPQRRASEVEAAKERLAAYRKALYDASGVYWGTRQLVDKAAWQSFADCRKVKARPGFTRYEGLGAVGVRIQRPQILAVGQALAGASDYVRIAQMPDPAGVTPGSRRSGRAAVLSLRVASDAAHKPIWARFPITMHRLPAPTARIVEARARCDRIGPHARWSVSITIDDAALPIHEDPKISPGRSGMIAMDLGWRARPDGTRAGYWRDGTGACGEFLLPAEIRERLKKAHSIGSIRDLAFNVFRKEFLPWLHDHSDQLPERLDRDLRTLWAWKSPDRLSRVARRWAMRLYLGAPEMPEALAAWFRNDRHLWSWEAHQTRRTIGRRDALYREWALDIARRYSYVVVEDFDIRSVANRKTRRKRKGDAAVDVEAAAAAAAKAQDEKASAARQAVAPGRMRAILVATCRKRGVPVEAVPCAWTTIDCAFCGCRIPWDPAPKIDHVCAGCGREVDQDDQACRNLLARASGGAVIESREELAARSSERRERMQAGKARKRALRLAAQADLSQAELQDAGTPRESDSAVEQAAHGLGT